MNAYLKNSSKSYIGILLPKKLKQELHRHTVFTVQEKGWSGLENGDLLRVAV